MKKTRTYRRMTWDDRVKIETLYNMGHTLHTIAKQTGFAVSSIHYEIKRGQTKRNHRYSAHRAHKNAVANATAKGHIPKLVNNLPYAEYVARKIRNGESPDVITGRLRKQGKWTVSTPTLYRYIDKGFIPGVTNKNLPEKSRRKKHSYNRIKIQKHPFGISIEQRPDIVDTRKTFGHWEMDSLVGKSKGDCESFLVLTERKTRYEIICRVPDKTSASTVHILDHLFSRFPLGTFKTITVDNGTEFRDYSGMVYTSKGHRRTNVYYCHPYTSCERGSNERANRMIRRYFPKGHSLKPYRQKDCDRVAYWMNNLPRRILDYSTPAELFMDEIKTLQK